MNGPKVYLVSRPAVDWEAVQRFLDDRSLAWARSESASEAEELVELGGRICYMSFSGDRSKMRFPVDVYIRNLIDKGHESVLEHANWTLLIDRVSRAFSHQLVRHRAGFAFSQLSQQYHDESDANFIVPAGLESDHELTAVWIEAVERTHESYRNILRKLSASETDRDQETRRRLRSTARSLLPNATETSLVVTANARALRHFFATRGAILGDIEMRQVCNEVFQLVSSDSPALFCDFEASVLEDGWPIVRRKFEKPE